MTTALRKNKPRATLQRRTLFRVKVIIAFLAVCFALILGRAFQLMVVEHDTLLAMAQNTRMQKVRLMPHRGAIYDRNGEPLALNIESDSVFVRPKKLGDQKDAARKLSRALHLEPSYLDRKFNSESPFVWVKRQISHEQSAALNAMDIQGVGMVKEAARSYPYGCLGASLIGITGVDLQGLEGVEAQFDNDLRGEGGLMRGERDALGQMLFPDGIVFEGTRPGNAIELTIDAKIQFYADTALAEGFEKTHAAGACAIVMDPQSGEVLAMSSLPSFNPNEASAYRRNISVTDIFEPGSTFKPFAMAAAIESGSVDLGKPIHCENGAYPFGGHVIHDAHPYAELLPEQIIQKSSNVGILKITAAMGAEPWYEFIRKFGFGSRIGKDFIGESSGLVRNVKNWRRIDIATSSFGQGISVTPLQLTTAFSALVNGGNLMRPYLIRQVVDPEGKTLRKTNPMIVRRVISPKTSREITRMLSLVTQPGGTATRAAIPGYTVAGKTGTAQKPDPEHGRYFPEKKVSSFIGAVPAENPEIVVLVLFDDPKGSRSDKYGGICAAPVFQKIAQRTLHYRKRFEALPDENPVQTLEVKGPSAKSAPIQIAQDFTDPNVTPNMVGLSVRNALRKGETRKLDLTIIGSGVSVRQIPKPGTPLDKTRHVTVLFRPAS